MRFLLAGLVAISAQSAQTSQRTAAPPTEVKASVDARLHLVDVCPQVSSQCGVPSTPTAEPGVLAPALDCMLKVDLSKIPQGPCHDAMKALLMNHLVPIPDEPAQSPQQNRGAQGPPMVPPFMSGRMPWNRGPPVPPIMLLRPVPPPMVGQPRSADRDSNQDRLNDMRPPFGDRDSWHHDDKFEDRSRSWGRKHHKDHKRGNDHEEKQYKSHDEKSKPWDRDDKPSRPWDHSKPVSYEHMRSVPPKAFDYMSPKPWGREDKYAMPPKPWDRENKHSKPFGHDGDDDDDDDDDDDRRFVKSWDREDKHSKPWDRDDDKQSKPWDRDPEPWDREDKHSKPWDREDKHSKPWDREDKHSKPWDREDKHSKPWDREDKHSKPWDRDDDKHSKPWDREDRDSKPWDREGRDSKPWDREGRDSKPWDREDRDSKPWDREDRDSKPWGRDDDKQSKPWDRDSKPWDREDKQSKPWDRDNKPSKPWDRDDERSKSWDREDKHSKPWDREDNKQSKPWDREDKQSKPWDRDDDKQSKTWDREDKHSSPCDKKDKEFSKFSNSDDSDSPMKLPFFLMHQPFGAPSQHQGFSPFHMWGSSNFGHADNFHPSFPFPTWTRYGGSSFGGDQSPMDYGFPQMHGPMRPPMFGPQMNGPVHPPMFGSHSGPMFGPQMNRPPMYGSMNYRSQMPTQQDMSTDSDASSPSLPMIAIVQALMARAQTQAQPQPVVEIAALSTP